MSIMKKKQNEEQKNSKRSLFITIFLMLIVIVTGTYAWYSYRTNDTAMVLTIGDIEKVRVTLSPYQIKGTFSPSLTYTGNEYTQVTAVNNDSSAGKISLFYRINSIDTNLKSTYFKYTVLKSTDGSSYSSYLTGNFSSASDGGEVVLTSSETIPANSTYYYRVYLWIDGSSGDQSNMQGKVFDGELRASIL